MLLSFHSFILWTSFSDVRCCCAHICLLSCSLIRTRSHLQNRWVVFRAPQAAGLGWVLVGWKSTRRQMFRFRHNDVEKTKENQLDFSKWPTKEGISRQNEGDGLHRPLKNSPKLLETARVVLAMTTCLTRIRSLASTREAPVVGGQPEQPRQPA